SERVVVVGSVVDVVDDVVAAVVTVVLVSGRALTSSSLPEQALATSNSTRRDANSRPVVAAMAVMLLPRLTRFLAVGGPERAATPGFWFGTMVGSQRPANGRSVRGSADVSG
ncbi:MAG: hypothetical protein AAFO29_21300, partial [Actinomycetota bacterium]